MKSCFYYLHALSALHVGTGQGAGVIDLPIAREKASHLPYLPGSGLKGVLREELRPDEEAGKPRWEALFGPERVQDDNGYAGALTVNDAHLLCFPVRSLAGTFAWASCPFILARYAREAQWLSIETPAIPQLPDEKTASITTDPVLTHQDILVLEDLDLAIDKTADEWAKHIAEAVFANDTEWQGLFKPRFAILPDGVLDFLAETATEVRARIRIDSEKRTVAKGALWYEENLPAESILYGVVGAERSRHKELALNDSDMLTDIPSGPLRLQLGGKASVGRGQVRWIKQGV